MNRSDLKQSLLKGGFYLAIRQLLSLSLSLASLLIITRHLGPKQYGWVVIALSLIPFTASLADMGLKTYLIRKEGECTSKLQGEVLLSLIINGSLITCVTILASPFISQWLGIPELSAILAVMAPSILFDACAGAPLGILERNLQYQKTTISELGSLLIYYGSAIFLVLMGWGIWSVAISYLVKSIFQVVTAFYFNPIFPMRPNSLEELSTAYQYGVSYSIANWAFSARGVLIPVMIGKFIGSEAVGLVGATTRMADTLAFMKPIVWQLGISGFAKLQEDFEAMRKALSRAMVYQTLLLTSLLGCFICLSPFLIPILLGHTWNSIVELFPFIALVFIIRGITDLHALALFAQGHNLEVLKANLANTILVCILVAFLGSYMNIWGYAAAEVIGLFAYILLIKSVNRIIGSPNYRPTLSLMACTVIPFICGNRLSPLVSLPVLLMSFGIAYLSSKETAVATRDILSNFSRFSSFAKRN